MKKRKFLSMAIMGTVLLVAGCGTGKKTANDIDLSGEWNITEVNGEKLTLESLPFIGLDMQDKQVYGNAGCNRMMGGFELDSLVPGKIKFTQIATTRMMCPEMETERKVLEALDKVEGYADVAGDISLTDAEGNNVMKLTKREPVAMTIENLSGEWQIVAVEGVTVRKTETTPFLGFVPAEKRVYGNAGCNTISGGFTQEEGKPNSLQFSQMVSTMMACADMELEGQILKAVDKVRSFVWKDDKSVVLLDGGGDEVLTLVKNKEAVALPQK